MSLRARPTAEIASPLVAGLLAGRGGLLPIGRSVQLRGRGNRPLLDRSKLADARPDQSNGEPWRWDSWDIAHLPRVRGARLLDVDPRFGTRTTWAAGNGLDHELPGFGPFGTAGAHCFDSDHPLYRRIAAITAVRGGFPVLRLGRQYLRPVSIFGEPFGSARADELFGWSRILVDEEALCVVNPNGSDARGAPC